MGRKMRAEGLQAEAMDVLAKAEAVKECEYHYGWYIDQEDPDAVNGIRHWNKHGERGRDPRNPRRIHGRHQEGADHKRRRQMPCLREAKA